MVDRRAYPFLSTHSHKLQTTREDVLARMSDAVSCKDKVCMYVNLNASRSKY